MIQWCGRFWKERTCLTIAIPPGDLVVPVICMPGSAAASRSEQQGDSMHMVVVASVVTPMMARRIAQVHGLVRPVVRFAVGPASVLLSVVIDHGYNPNLVSEEPLGNGGRLVTER